MKKTAIIAITALGFISFSFSGAGAAGNSITIDDFDKQGIQYIGTWADNQGHNDDHLVSAGVGCQNRNHHYTSSHGSYRRTGKEKAIYKPNITQAGDYKVEVNYRASGNRSTKVTYQVDCASGSKTKTFSQRNSGPVNLGVFTFAAGTGGTVSLVGDGGASASVDYARFTYVGASGTAPAGPSDTGSTPGLGERTGMDDVLTPGEDRPANVLDTIRLESAGSKTYTFTEDGTAVVKPHLSTFGNASLSVNVKSGGSKETEWIKWERSSDTDKNPLMIDGEKEEESIVENSPGDFSPSDTLMYKREAKKGDIFTISMQGNFGSGADPFLEFKAVKK
ncbi:MAG TPA: hypothetical protein DC017_16400 [Candidatus Wallbacteria bacterium]|nr:hypothetical protein [Candidatus Wallbacteria bacterium]